MQPRNRYAGTQIERSIRDGYPVRTETAVKDYYEILELDEDATQDAVKKAYRRLARKYHPDRNPGDESASDHFKVVQEAYEVLSDESARRRYDRQRRNPFGPGRDHVTSGGSHFRRTPDGTYIRFDTDNPAGDADPFGGFGDLFSRMFGGESTGSTPEQPAEMSIEISFEQMLKGGKARFTIPGGRQVELPFPAGVRDGYRVRVRAKGAADRLVRFRVRPDDRFRREGDDLHSTIRVNAFEALLGTSKSIETPYGKRLKITIPKGTQPGDRLRVRGQGVRAEGRTGDLIMELDVTVPKDLDAEDEKAIREAARNAGLL